MWGRTQILEGHPSHNFALVIGLFHLLRKPV